MVTKKRIILLYIMYILDKMNGQPKEIQFFISPFYKES